MTPRPVRRPAAPLERESLAEVLAPFGHSRMLPRAAYVEPDVLEWEQRWFFDDGWVCVGRSADLMGPGDQRATRAGRTGVLLVREADGSLAAFANICRHRGHELLACGATTNRGVIQCPYHAWSYELDGALRLAPRFDGAANFEPGAFGLVPIRVHEWGGWAFVNVSGSAPAFEVQMGDLTTILAPWGCDQLVPAAAHTYTVAANWKLLHENYQECYHCPLIHPELCRVSPPLSGDNYERGEGAWVGGIMALAEGAATMSLDGRSAGVVLPGLSAVEQRQVVYVAVFPSLLVSLHPDYVMTHRMEPLSPTETTVECQWLFSEEAVDRPGFDSSYAVDFWDLTNRQDWAAVESVQRGLASPSFVPGVLAEQEDAVYQLVTLLARGYLGETLTPQVATRSEDAGT